MWLSQQEEQELRSVADHVYQYMTASVSNEWGEHEWTDWAMNRERWDWNPGVGIIAQADYYEVTGRQVALKDLIGWMHRNDGGAQEAHTVNGSAPFVAMPSLFQATGDPTWLSTAIVAGEWLLRDAPRTREGAFEHTVTEKAAFPEQVWADTVFMAVLLLARLANVTKRSDFAEEAERQLRIHLELLQDESSGVLFHGWDCGAGNHLSAARWTRANAWIVLGAPMIMEAISGMKEADEALITRYRHLAEALVSYQAEDGLWPTVLDQPSFYTETSGSAGIACGLLKAIRIGWLSDAESTEGKYQSSAMAALHGVLARIDASGRVNGVSGGTPVMPTVAAYSEVPVFPTLYGQGLTLLLLTEVLRWVPPVDGGRRVISETEARSMMLSFEDRGQVLLEAVNVRSIPPLDAARWHVFTAIAKLGLGIDVVEAERRIAVASGMPQPESIFVRYGLIDVYCRFGVSFQPETVASIKVCLLEESEYLMSGGTENHKLMRAVTGYLTAQAWPEWSDAQSVSERCSVYMDQYFASVTHYGQGEFDSTTYAVLYFNSLATLYDFAADPAMKLKAGMMLDWFLANTAGEWLDGLFTGAHSRDYHPMLTFEDGPGGTVAAWLYFGGKAPNLSAGEPHYSAVNVLSSYRVPAALILAARERMSPFVHRESHDVTGLAMPTHDGNETRVIDNSALRGRGYISRVGVRKLTYMTPGYALGSMTDGTVGDVIWSGQLRRWSLQWHTEAGGGAFFFHHPFPDYGNEGERYVERWLGSSPYEQIAQHEGALIALYDIPLGGIYKYGPRQAQPADADPYIDGFLPMESLLRLEEDEASGWLFAHGGSVLLAVRTLRPYRWVLRDGRRERLRCDGLRHAVIVQTVEPASFAEPQDARLAARERVDAELRRFRTAMLERTVVESVGVEHASGELAASFIALSGDLLAFTFNGERSVNGQPIDFGAWPLIDNPYLHSEVGTGLMEARVDARAIVRWDFNAWTVTDRRENEFDDSGGGEP